LFYGKIKNGGGRVETNVRDRPFWKKRGNTAREGKGGIGRMRNY
jgi:hypothetical protein